MSSRIREVLSSNILNPRRFSRRGFLRAAIGVSVLGTGAGAYGHLCELHWVEVVEKSMPVLGLPASLVGAKLIQLSDLHIGSDVDPDYLRETFDRVRELAPDIVVYTGDFTTNEKGILERAKAMFPFLPHGRLGTLGVLGNHDYGRWYRNPKLADRLSEAAHEVGVRILRNEVVEVQGLQVVGLDDWWAGRFDARKGLGARDRERASVVLSHNPDTVDLPGWEDYSGWILCGHTHGGQCRAPFLPPPMLPVRNRNYVAGEYALTGGRRMYINRGVGHLLPVRFNVRPEITLFRLELGRGEVTAGHPGRLG